MFTEHLQESTINSPENHKLRAQQHKNFAESLTSLLFDPDQNRKEITKEIAAHVDAFHKRRDAAGPIRGQDVSNAAHDASKKAYKLSGVNHYQ